MPTKKWFSGLTAVVASALILSGCGRTSFAPPAGETKNADFKTASVPAGFLWGVSTAGQQYEGYDTNSNWFSWWSSGKTLDKNPFGANGYKMYAEDALLAKGLGCNAFRTSIEWSRIEPKPGVIDQEAVAYYHRLLDTLHSQGMTPVMTLHHFGHPQWVEAKGGWENKETPALFAKFAAFCAKEYGSKVDLWLTFNEPNTYLLGGFVAKAFPPGKQDPFAGLRAMKNMVKGHGMAYDAVHENDPTAKVSFNMYTAEFQVGGARSQDETTPEERATERLGNDNTFMDEVMALRRNGGSKVDFAALDYYCKFRLTVPFKFPEPDTWEVYPEGMYKAIKRYYAKYKLPVLIAENGMATRDGKPRADGWTRSRYLVTHLKQMQRAMAEGVPVMGYIHWSITDNWEWGSYTPTFGLYRVDARNQNWTRVPADGVDAFRSIVKSNGVTKAIEYKYGLLPQPWKEGGTGTPVSIYN